VLGTKSIHAAEVYVLGLFQLYPTVYYHKATRGAEKLFTVLLLRIFSLVKDGGKNYAKTNLPKNHPLIVFAKKPESLDNALCLDDTVIMGALTLISGATDNLIRDFSTRLQQRKLYKCIDVWEQVSQRGVEAEQGRGIKKNL
jgi:HD superfamily phosphohydrolase